MGGFFVSGTVGLCVYRLLRQWSPSETWSDFGRRVGTSLLLPCGGLIFIQLFLHSKCIYVLFTPRKSRLQEDFLD